MAKKLSPPVLHKRWPLFAGLGGIALIATFFRLWEIIKLPPGLSAGDASIGLSAVALIQNGTIPSLTTTDGFSPLWTLMQVIPVYFIGHTELALHIWPVIIGILAVGAVWLWANDWFTTRVAWVATLIMAVNPWAVTLSRSASPAVLATLLLPLSLFLGARAVTRGKLFYWVSAGLILVIDLFAGPIGWIIAALTVVLGLITVITNREVVKGRASWIGLFIAFAGLVGASFLAATEQSGITSLITGSQFTLNMTSLGTTLGKVVGMFNLHGDDNFYHNFNGEPLLNAFVGLMFVAGLLVIITRLMNRRYLAILVALVVTLLPALLSPLGAPNAFHAAAALPVAVVLSGIGVGYMLELWHATFPINSAARSTGLAAILLLLGLSVFQGYIQVFRAWSGSVETYVAYNEAAVAVASRLNERPAATKSISGTFVVTTAEEATVISYLADRSSYTSLINPAGIIDLAQTPGTSRFLITAAVRDDTARNLALRFAGGKLAPHYSDFSQNELYYGYEITQ
jgi:hypothetical protein